MIRMTSPSEMRVLGIDPGFSGTGWCCLRELLHVSSGTALHQIRGKGYWDAKARAIRTEMLRIVDLLKPGMIFIEKPPFGSRGRQGPAATAAMHALLATMDLAWSLAFAFQGQDYNVSVMIPDTRTKAKRSVSLASIIQEFPKRTNEHVRDAAWLVLRGIKLT